MTSDLALLLGGVALFAVAGTVLGGLLARWVNDGARRLAAIVPLAVAGPLGLACGSFGAYRLYRRLGLAEHGLPTAAFTAAGLALAGLLGGALILTTGSRPDRGDDGRGGDDLPPPPDPDGPDGWAEFERQFRIYARERDRLLV